MKLTNVHLSNFRCFQDYTISFGTHATVLIGKNGTGKTSLIKGLKSAMSFIFSKHKMKDTDYTLVGNTADLHIVNLSKWDAFIDENSNPQYPISIECAAKFNNEPINWAIVKNTANGKLLDTQYRDAFLTFTKHYNLDLKSAEIPVLAFFSDSYPHKKINIGSNAKEILKSGRYPRAFGYYQWDAETNCSEIWQNCYVSQYSKINDFKNTEQETQKERAEINYIDDKIIRFTSALDAKYDFINEDFIVKKILLERPFKDDLFLSIKFVFENGREILFENLPQGYNRLFSIVFDIAYRSYFLNGNAEPQGVVFIDEIDLHLHPTLQQEVLQRFQKTFPNIQFIVTTHSPLVISNLNADGIENKIFELENDGTIYANKEVENAYGLDYSTNLSEIMGVAPRSSTIDKYINAYLFLYRKKRDTEADLMLQKLKDYIGGAIPPLLQKEIDAQK